MCDDEPCNFLNYHKIDEKGTNLNKALIMTYFTLTTLTTIGLGDYYPVSNFERISWTFFLLGGVLIFSYINKELILMILKINELDCDEDHSIELASFIM